MKIRSFALLAVSLSITLGACVYSDSGTYYAEPVPGEKAVDSIVINLDTIADPEVTEDRDLEIEYRMQIWNGEPYYVDCQLENFRIYELSFFWGTDEILIYFSDTVFTVETDTTAYVVDSDTVFLFTGDPLSQSYTLAGSFLVQSSLPVLPGDHSLQIYFYYSSNTNSLADILNVEADVAEREYTISFETGGVK